MFTNISSEKRAGELAVIAGDAGGCDHWGNERDGPCRFRKVHTPEDRRIEKCSGSTFRFERPGIRNVALSCELESRMEIYEILVRMDVGCAARFLSSHGREQAHGDRRRR